MTALRIISIIAGIIIIFIGLYHEMKTIKIMKENPNHDSGEACLCIIMSVIILLTGMTMACYGPEIVIGISDFLST